MRILALEPYYGGSHQAFLDQWIHASEHDWQLLTLPAHHWKWRMRHAGIWFASQIKRLAQNGPCWDLVFCSDMLDLTQFLGLVDPPLAALPRVVYFHENQLTYPTRAAGERDLHFALTNFTTALAADQVWFNSEFHRRSFLDAACHWLTSMPDHVPADELAAVRHKSTVQSPGIEALQHQHTTSRRPLHITWAARWEHDKSPGTLFDALRLLQQDHVDFRLTVCGQSFRDVPPEFADARHDLAQHIDQWGPLPARSDYLKQLRRGHVFVSTATHEFFGLAVMEAVAAGLFPMLPQRLSYPELLGLAQQPDAGSFFYDGSAEHLAHRLTILANNPATLDAPRQKAILRQAVQRYDWSNRAAAMDRALSSVKMEG